MDPHTFRRLKAGDTSAFDAVVRRFGPTLYRQISGRVWDPEEARDLLQEVFLSAFRRISQLRDPERLGSWLAAIAKNQVLMRHRRRVRQLELEAILTREAQHASAVPDGDLEVRALLRRALHSLTDDHRDVIAYHYYKNYSYREAGGLLALTEDGVRSRLQKARDRLRKEIKRMNGQDVSGSAYELSKPDLEALALAAGSASTDKDRPLLNTVCLDAGGTVVGTDGAHLVKLKAAGLAELPAPVVLGPLEALDLDGRNAATLSIGIEEAVLSDGGGAFMTLPIMDEAYVKYEQVIPTGSVCSCTVRAGALVELLERIEPFLEPLHPLPSEEWRYLPMVELRLDSGGGTIALGTNARIGFSWEGPGNPAETPEEAHRRREIQPDLSTDWVFRTSADAEIQGSPEREGVARVGANHRLFCRVVRALRLEEDDRLEIRFEGEHKAMVFTQADAVEDLSLLMPMRLVG